ncbi:MAG: AcrR family transcriptional regulator [Oceanicoccus sp.]|jgi:AcrR family transcriptional regulator
MISVLDNITSAADLKLAPTELTSLASFIESFPLQGESLYSIVFDRNGDIVQTQKARFAVANLEKILTATFAVSATSGFDRMSLRDLSRQTGMSMGSIYSCISKKEDIALMIADIVRLSSELTRQHAMQSDSMWSKIEQSIRFHLYASTLLQPWYFFLYFETRCLPETQQRESKQIELDGIRSFETQIQSGVDAGEFYTSDARMVANTIVVLLEDWYLKPWKTLSPWKANISIEQQEKQINNYSQSIIELVRKLLADS